MTTARAAATPADDTAAETDFCAEYTDFRERTACRFGRIDLAIELGHRLLDNAERDRRRPRQEDRDAPLQPR